MAKTTNKTNDTRLTKNEAALLLKIAQEHLFLETLETRNSDRLDFHDLSTEGIRRALIAAYKAGQASK